MTAKQQFNAACDEALKTLRDMPVDKVLNRLDIYELREMKRALAQQFTVLIRNAAEGVDVNRPRPKLRERLAKMRDVEGQPSPTPDEDEPVGGAPPRARCTRGERPLPS